MGMKLAYISLFFLTMNLFAIALMSSGVAADLGMTTQVGGDEEVSQATSQADSIKSGSPTGSTLFGMYNSLASALKTLALPVTAGPMMLKHAGVPGLITDGILAPVIGFVYATGIISLLMRFEVL